MTEILEFEKNLGNLWTFSDNLENLNHIVRLCIFMRGVNQVKFDVEVPQNSRSLVAVFAAIPKSRIN